MNQTIGQLVSEKQAGSLEKKGNPQQSSKPTKSFSDILKEKTESDKLLEKNPNPRSKSKNAADNKEKCDTAKKALAKKLSNPQGSEISSLYHYLYDLVYRDPATWSMGDREMYDVHQKGSSWQEFHKMLSARGLKLQDFSYEHFTQMTQLNTKRQLSAFLDQLAREMMSTNENTQTIKSSEGTFSNSDTSLQKLESQEGVKESEVIKQILKQISLRKVRGGTEAKLILNPKELGEIHLALTVKGNKVSARFKASEKKVQKILEAHLKDLAEGFSSQGLEVQNLEVQFEASEAKPLFASGFASGLDAGSVRDTKIM
jgi:flagellar hook-length control protein FliK